VDWLMTSGAKARTEIRTLIAAPEALRHPKASYPKRIFSLQIVISGVIDNFQGF
jgi:hypothetical protein